MVLVMLLFSTILFAESLKNVPTLTEANAYFQKWAYGDGANKPGYIVDFELPEKVWLDRKGISEADLKKEGSGYPGSTDGAVVFMGGNGEKDKGEFPLQADVCVSTDEAMGYGMMLAVMANKPELFKKLARVAKYYRCHIPAYDKLTSWVIPAESEGNHPEYDAMVTQIQGYLADGWKYDKIDGWAETPLKLWGIPEKPTYVNGKIKGQKVLYDDKNVVLQHNKGTVSGIALDGALDIAFSFLMAHYEWQTVGDLQKGEYNYLGMACERFAQIIQVLETFAIKINMAKKFLPLGSYNLLKEGSNGVTRPSDWLVTHLRAYFECVGSEEARNFVGILQDQMSDFVEEDNIASNVNSQIDGVAVPNQPSDTGLFPDFAEFDGSTDDLDIVKTSSVYETNKEHFYINVARFPLRQALDYLMYGDEYTLNKALGTVALPYAKYKENYRAFHADPENKDKKYDYSYAAAGNPFAACMKVDGTTLSGYNWTNRLMISTMLTAIYAGNEAGITKYNDMFNAYIDTGDVTWEKYNVFDSQYKAHWQNSSGYVRRKSGQEITDKNFPLHLDTKENTGYFEDTWALLAMYTMAGRWERPHAFPNEFEDPGTNWAPKADSANYVTVTESNGVVTATIKNSPGDKPVTIVVEDFVTKINSGYAFLMSIKRENGNGASNIEADLYYPDVTAKTKNMAGEITIEEDGITRGYMGHLTGVLKTDELNGMGEQQRGRLEILLNAKKTGLVNDTVFTLSQLGFYDPPNEVQRYRYVDIWRSDEPYYLVGDYVSYQQETWVCIKEHDLIDPVTGNPITPLIRPEEGSEYWEIF